MIPTTQRELAAYQRGYLKASGSTEAEITAFAEVFNPEPAPGPQVTCAADQEEDDR